MSQRFGIEKYYNPGVLVTTTSNVAIGPLDVSNFERFAVTLQNLNTGIGINTLVAQSAFDPSANFDNGSNAPNWVNIPTATLALPTAVGASSIVLTTGTLNCFKYIRFIVAMSATAAQGTIRVMVGGPTRA